MGRPEDRVHRPGRAVERRDPQAAGLAKALMNAARRRRAREQLVETSGAGALDWPPVAISIERTPLPAAMSSACSKECSVSESVYRPMSTGAPSLVSPRPSGWLCCRMIARANDCTAREDDHAARPSPGPGRRTRSRGIPCCPLRIPIPRYRRLREEAPLFHHAGRDVWAFSRFEDVQRAARDWATLLEPRRQRPRRHLPAVPPAGDLAGVDPPVHTRLRNVFRRPSIRPRSGSGSSRPIRVTATRP